MFADLGHFSVKSIQVSSLQPARSEYRMPSLHMWLEDLTNSVSSGIEKTSQFDYIEQRNFMNFTKKIHDL
jgi:hypothetical protein